MAGKSPDTVTAPQALRSAPRGLAPLRWLAPFVLAALALRVIPLIADEAAASASGNAADAPQLDQPGQTFPGSAYFFAEGAFAAAPGTMRPAGGNPHILAIDVGPAAASYRFAGRTALDRTRALSCLTNAIYYEAANEPDEGQRAVAQVVLNRLRHPAWPNTVCGVVYQGTERDDLHCQFTFSCNGAMARLPNMEKWLRARRVAEAALRGEVFAPVGLATYYHTLTIFPAWASQMRPSAIIGAHIFYRMPGAQGALERFADRYEGIETVNGPSANAYLAPRETPEVPLIPTVPELVGTPAAQPELPPPSRPVQVAPSSNLPESTIRPEFRNSGRPLS